MTMVHTTAAAPRFSLARRTSAWAVHVLTASGAVWGLLALVAIGESSFRPALGFMALALAIDGVDGALARWVGAERVVRAIDGALLDNLVDYLNYVIVPAYLIERAALLPPGWGLGAAGLICLASAFQFAHREAKTDDLFFRGFPSYWNIVAFYLLLLRFDRRVALAIVLALCVLTFVPLRYVYPSRTREHRPWTLVATLLWAAALGVLLLTYPAHERWLVYASLAYGVYYVALSFWLGRSR